MPKKKKDYEILGVVELPDEITAKVNRMIEEAEEDLAEIRVNFRWGKQQLEIVKRAAEVMGVPYQTYIKQVIFRQSLQDIKAASDVTPRKRA